MIHNKNTINKNKFNYMKYINYININHNSVNNLNSELYHSKNIPFPSNRFPKEKIANKFFFLI